MYTAYCEGVGGVAFNGDPLPSWEEFRADPAKAKQADAWEVAAESATAFHAANTVVHAETSRFMRAKMKVSAVTMGETLDTVKMAPVCKSGAYAADGLDEDNTFAKFSPSGSLELTIANPALLGTLRPGQAYYLDFTRAS